MERKSKRLIVKGKTYVLDLAQGLDAMWEGRTSGPNGVFIVRTASERDAKYFSHFAAYYNESERRDRELEDECENGWE